MYSTSEGESKLYLACMVPMGVAKEPKEKEKSRQKRLVHQKLYYNLMASPGKASAQKTRCGKARWSNDRTEQPGSSSQRSLSCYCGNWWHRCIARPLGLWMKPGLQGAGHHFPRLLAAVRKARASATVFFIDIATSGSQEKGQWGSLSPSTQQHSPGDKCNKLTFGGDMGTQVPRGTCWGWER